MKGDVPFFQLGVDERGTSSVKWYTKQSKGSDLGVEPCTLLPLFTPGGRETGIGPAAYLLTFLSVSLVKRDTCFSTVSIT